ncbi:acyltransferase family protein [Neptunicella sp.]|uniref:acyltransferase family protein n=1 Tax=Neptunicella sp. TaxID=2125986 RepID=UPI003F68CC0F
MQQTIKKQRVAAIDVLRGLTIALMILVNTPGSWGHVYWPFLHADWSGATPTDMVFPFFVFIVGAAMYYALASARTSGNIPWGKLVKRASLMFLIGFLLNIFPFNENAENWRILGVLQRIAVCYLFGAVLILLLSTRQLIGVCVAILLGYWLLLTIGSSQPYGLETNLVRQIDLAILGANHLWQGKGIAFDPEGLLSDLPAIVTLISGYLTCLWLAKTPAPVEQIKKLLAAGIPLILLALVWHHWHPINKSLWTGSFVFLTTGVAMSVLALIIWAWEVVGIRAGMEQFRIYGSNPLVGYVGSELFAICLATLVTVNYQGQAISGYQYGFEILNQWMPAKAASLLFACLVVSLFYIVALYLYKKKWFVKL